MKFPDKAARDRGDGTVVVLCYHAGEFEPWVTARWSPRYESEWFWGHYFNDEGKARKDFAER